MTNEEIRAILTICLLASYADGEKHDREREQIRQVAEGLAGIGGIAADGTGEAEKLIHRRPPSHRAAGQGRVQ